VIDYELENKNKLNQGILPENVDSNIKKEFLKHIAILHLEEDQLPHKLEIAKNVLDVVNFSIVLKEIKIYLYY
jgi:hypothetical protein